MYAFVSGPLALIAFVVFILGLLFQIVRFFRMTRKKEAVGASFPKPRKKDVQAHHPPEEVRKKVRTRGTVMEMEPFMVVLTTVFHLLLILTPILLLAHNLMINMAWGFQPPSLSEGTSDVLTVLIMGFCIFFFLRRIFSDRVRAISTPYDFLLLLIVFLPFLTGFIAYHQFFAYKTMALAHVLAGELMLVCIPFTKLVHMIFFFLYRFFLPGEYSFASGSRVWR
jgi:nitrate reductase gamma subunit